MVSEDDLTCNLIGLGFARYKKQVQAQNQQSQAQQLLELIEKQHQAQRSHEQQEDYLRKSFLVGNRENDTVEDDEDDDEMLINEVKSFRCLWGTRCRSYKENQRIAEAWRAIASKLHRSGEFFAPPNKEKHCRPNCKFIKPLNLLLYLEPLFTLQNVVWFRPCLIGLSQCKKTLSFSQSAC